MGKTPEEVVKGFATAILGMDEQGVSALLEAEGSFKDDALEVLKATDAKRIAKVKGDVDGMSRERYSLGKKEALTKLEQEVKDKFGIQSDKQGLELLEEAVEIARAKLPKGDTLKEEDIKKLPLYRTLEQQLQAQEQTFAQKLDAALKAKDAEHNRERVSNMVKAEAQDFLNTLDPILHDDPVKRATFQALYLDQVASLSYQVENDNGKASFLLLDKDGKRLEDQHGHPVKVNEKWKAIASSIYDFKVSEERHSAPANGNAGGNGASKTLVVKKPGSYAEWEEMMVQADGIKDAKVRAETQKKLLELKPG